MTVARTISTLRIRGGPDGLHPPNPAVHPFPKCTLDSVAVASLSLGQGRKSSGKTSYIPACSRPQAPSWPETELCISTWQENSPFFSEPNGHFRPNRFVFCGRAAANGRASGAFGAGGAVFPRAAGLREDAAKDADRFRSASQMPASRGTRSRDMSRANSMAALPCRALVFVRMATSRAS